MTQATPLITILVEDPASRDRELERAISLLRNEATGCGILVTRVEFTTFTVAICPDVAYGLTQEADLLRQKPAGRLPKIRQAYPHQLS
ncbi:hypothetical protein HTS88_21735 [Pseudarthrobacter oxydans]|uniref:hypothetical protein n=1 Tax=Pseudarthrobacter oxydans TaxID=1671 RepID=UPI001572F50D|nr:hypothetical protein [Pseudarthrobacter oxydans]NSX38998.1 hypothetical protein [Pseudarthrobacter oxydans]